MEENLLMGLSRFPGSEAKEVPAFIYELFPVLLQMKQRRGGDLSGGQQQQLAIGRALASRPRLLILDEPTEGIQPSVIKEIGAVIKKLAARGDMAILLVEQFYDFAAELAGSVPSDVPGRDRAAGARRKYGSRGCARAGYDLVCSVLKIIRNHESTCLFIGAFGHLHPQLACRAGTGLRPIRRLHASGTAPS